MQADIRRVPPASLAQAVREAAADVGVVGVCGGDGSLATAANILAGSETALAPFPGGTLNHFVRRLGIDDFEQAAAAMAGGEISRVPLGVIDDRIFLNTVTFGFYAGVVSRRERLRRWLRKWPGAAVSFAEQFARMPRYQLTLSVDGQVLLRSTPLIWVGVGWGSFPRVVETPDHGRAPDLEIVVLRPQSRLGMARLLFRMMKYLLRGERPTDDPGLEILHARTALIGGASRIPVTLDGEVLSLRGPVLVGLVDEALRVTAGVRSSRSAGGVR